MSTVINTARYTKYNCNNKPTKSTARKCTKPDIRYLVLSDVHINKHKQIHCSVLIQTRRLQHAPCVLLLLMEPRPKRLPLHNNVCELWIKLRMEYYAIVFVCVVLHLPNSAVEGSMQDLTHYYDNHVIRWPGHKPWVYNLNRKPFITITNKTLW